jgi:hypothetical protein
VDAVVYGVMVFFPGHRRTGFQPDARPFAYTNKTATTVNSCDLAAARHHSMLFGWLDRLLVGQMHYQPGIAVAVGGTVAFAWSVLALSKQWQSEPGWIDGTGRVLGTAAIAAALIVITHFGI